MKFTEEGIYHIYNRGNKKQPIFFQEKNYMCFIRKARTELLPYCEILAYCLMPNHFHFIVFIKPKACIPSINAKKNLNNGIAIVLRSYTRLMQTQEQFTGSLFQQKTKAKELIDSDNATINYLSLCAQYIHLNPLKARIVDNSKEWRFSSYLDYMKLRNGTLCNKGLFYLLAGINEEDFIKEHNAHPMSIVNSTSSSDEEKKFY